MTPTRRARVPELEAGRFVPVFLALVLMFLVLPFTGDKGPGGLAIEVTLLLVLLGSLRAVWGDPRMVVAATIPGLGLMASPSWGLFPPSEVTVLVSTISMAVCLVLVVSSVGIAVARATSVSLGTILGACSLYLLLGLFWFEVFATIDVLQGDAFTYVDTHANDRERLTEGVVHPDGVTYLMERHQLFYFTFVTITTLGYGDIRPVSELARIYATLAAISGQLFIAILVARLVGIQSAQAVSPRETE